MVTVNLFPQLQEDEELLITPYEKNLDFWRQLWRVIERSDVVVQIVDARDPLLFRYFVLKDGSFSQIAEIYGDLVYLKPSN